ncbi:MAG: hypothetical protein JW881_09340 [Spirochaetales bacterium]|nr:hypothetical protein [Spirochaetales bacterium]
MEDGERGGISSHIKAVLDNIEYAHHLTKKNKSTKVVIVVSGNEADRLSWQKRLDKTSPFIFNIDGSTKVISLEEKTGDKTREGNFLGTLLAYNKFKDMAGEKGISYNDSVILLGMVFGRGERMSPFTQIEGDRKPAIVVSSTDGEGPGNMSAIEEGLLYFTPVVDYIQSRGFRGILDKWGDETEIPSIDLSAPPASPDDFASYDVIKFISIVKITDELAKQKDWTVVDDECNIVRLISRNDKAVIVKQLLDCGVEAGPDNFYYAGVSLGPVAVSYDVLDIAAEIFADEITREGVTIDFDPYFLMAFSMNSNFSSWYETVKRDRELRALLEKVPDFLEKVQKIKVLFAQRHGRPVNFKALDMGDRIYWADIGLHHAMREKYLSLLDTGGRGIIARKLENISDGTDAHGNRIVNSFIADGIDISDSVVVNSTLRGRGIIKKSVIKDSILANPSMIEAFAVLSVRPSGKTVLKPGSGVYRSIGLNDLVLEEGIRQGTMVTKEGPIDLAVSEKTDLRDRERTYKVPIMGNRVSFAEAYEMMFGISEEELDAMRRNLIERIREA